MSNIKIDKNIEEITTQKYENKIFDLFINKFGAEGVIEIITFLNKYFGDDWYDSPVGILKRLKQDQKNLISIQMVIQQLHHYGDMMIRFNDNVARWEKDVKKRGENYSIVFLYRASINNPVIFLEILTLEKLWDLANFQIEYQNKFMHIFQKINS